jgi:hypothetical protein
MSETYEVHVSDQHWAEGCDFAMSEYSSECCPVYRAMAEAGLPVSRVYGDGWIGAGMFRGLPEEAVSAIRRFDAASWDGAPMPGPITFTVTLS